MSMLVMRCMVISIHAPPRGATGGIEAERDFKKFQFTPLREGRRKIKTIDDPDDLFQFTPLREGRLKMPHKLAKN